MDLGTAASTVVISASSTIALASHLHGNEYGMLV